MPEHEEIQRAYQRVLDDWNRSMTRWRTTLTAFQENLENARPRRPRSILTRLLTYHQNDITYAARLIDSQAAGLKAERENAKLRRTVDCLHDWFARASRRADAMEKARDLLKGDNDQLREHLDRILTIARDIGEPVTLAEERDHARSCLAQALAEKEDATTRILYLEGELADMERSRESMVDIADGLRTELKAVKGKKGRK